MPKKFSIGIYQVDSLEIKPNYAALGRQYGMDWRTVKKYHQGYRGKLKSRDKK